MEELISRYLKFHHMEDVTWEQLCEQKQIFTEIFEEEMSDDKIKILIQLPIQDVLHEFKNKKNVEKYLKALPDRTRINHNYFIHCCDNAYEQSVQIPDWKYVKRYNHWEKCSVIDGFGGGSFNSSL